MGNIPCDVIKDLLPLYVDDVCSERSKAEIEEHLAACESCREMYHALQEKLPEIVITEEEEKKDETKFIKGVKHDITIRQMMIVGIVLLLVLGTNVIGPLVEDQLAGTRYDLRQIPIFDNRVPVEDVELAELYQLKDGRIYYKLKSDKKITMLTENRLSPRDEKGKPTMSIPGTSYNKVYFYAGFRSSLWERFCGHPSYEEMGIITPAIDNPSQLYSYKEIAGIYYTGKGGEQKLLWEKGEKLKAAPERIEKRIREEENGTYHYTEETTPIFTCDSFDEYLLTQQ